MIRRLRADSRGFAFSLDVLLALIPLTIILGMAVANMDNIMYLSENTIFQSSLDRTAADAADVLVETPGVPYNWQEVGNASVVGLAIYDTSKNSTRKNFLSASKVAALTSSNLDALVGSGYGSSLTITTVNQTSSKLIKTVGTVNNSASNIVKVTREVSTSYLDVVASLIGVIRYSGAANTYTLSFSTNSFSSSAYDYWIFIKNNKYTSAPATVNGISFINSTELNVNTTTFKKQINSTFLSNNSTNTVSITPANSSDASMDVYIIAAPVGTSANEINEENVKVRDAILLLYVWTR